jgi:hypothetical protein
MSNLLKKLLIFTVVCTVTHSLQAQKTSSDVLSYDQVMGIKSSDHKKSASKAQNATLRLDMLTESQKDEIITKKDIPLTEICSIIINCPQNSDGPLLQKGDRIRLFNDSRISEVQILKVSGNKKQVMSKMTLNSKTSYLLIPNDVPRNDQQYILRIL